jgi:tetratricopeptide (TPR) repeat protein
MTREEFAELVGISDRQLATWERADTPMYARNARALDAIYDALTPSQADRYDAETPGAADVGDRQAEARPRPLLNAAERGARGAPPSASDTSAPADPRLEEGPGVDRRELFRHAGVLVAAALFPAALEPEAAPIEHFRDLRRVLVNADNLLGPGHVVPAVHEQIRVLQQLRQTTRGTDRHQVVHLQAEFGEFAGWLYQDLGDHQAAQYWTDRALEWSYAARDPALATYVLARKSQLAGDRNDAATAVDVAEAAVAAVSPGSKLAAVATTYVAHGYALAGDERACGRAYDSAHELLATSDRDAEWSAWLDGPYIEAQRARSLAVLGRFPAAVQGFERAVTALPPGYRRDRGVYLARTAIAQAGAGDIDQAAMLGLQALAIGVQTGSGRIAVELRRLDARLGGYDSAAVAQFRAGIRPAHSTSTP